MVQPRLIAILLAALMLSGALLTGCSEDQPAQDKKKISLQEEMGREAASSIEKPLAEARKAAAMQSAVDQKIKAASEEGFPAQERKTTGKLEGC